jgi:hypothetical protein
VLIIPFFFILLRDNFLEFLAISCTFCGKLAQIAPAKSVSKPVPVAEGGEGYLGG